MHDFHFYYNNHFDDSISAMYFSWSNMLDILAKIKTGKSSGGVIRPEHILHGSLKLPFHLHLLFNSMIQHGFVVSDFVHGTITPIVKDANGDVSASSNYRGITLGGLLSKLFEYGLDSKISNFLTSDHLQFGFKKQTSTSHALHVLRSTVDHFTSKGSDVFVAFLDCSKAFDRISHYGLFSKLIKRKVPLCLLMIIVHWHLNMICRVKWADVLSDEFTVPLGTKQGGISSPGFFAVYVDDMVTMLRRLGYGCHIINTFIGCILFADDLALLAPTRRALQRMIDACSAYCDVHCLTFNANKSKIMVFLNTHG